MNWIFFKKIADIFKPCLTTLKRYKIVFTTLDGEDYEYSRVNYIDDDTIQCSVGEYFLIGENFLEDDEGNIYPIENIQKIRFDLVDTIDNVIVKYVGGSIRQTWYSNNDIKIYPEKT